MEATNTLLVIERRHRDDRLLCVFNFGSTSHGPSALPAGKWRVLEAVGGAETGGLPPMSGLIAQRL